MLASRQSTESSTWPTEWTGQRAFLPPSPCQRVRLLGRRAVEAADPDRASQHPCDTGINPTNVADLRQEIVDRCPEDGATLCWSVPDCPGSFPRQRGLPVSEVSWSRSDRREARSTWTSSKMCTCAKVSIHGAHQPKTPEDDHILPLDQDAGASSRAAPDGSWPTASIPPDHARVCSPRVPGATLRRDLRLFAKLSLPRSMAECVHGVVSKTV